MERQKPKSEMMGGLESSLVELVHEHNKKALKLRDDTERSKKKALRAANRVSDVLVDRVNGGVQESFINEKRIEHEIRGLSSTIIRYTRQTDQWLASSNALNSALKEIGDFENWMKTMDYDCKLINTAIRNIHKAPGN